MILICIENIEISVRLSYACLAGWVVTQNREERGERREMVERPDWNVVKVLITDETS